MKFIYDFEQTAADIAISNQYDYVVCGHIHHPEIKEMANEHGKVMYLNSGDWIENLTALEYANGEWCIYKFDELARATMTKEHATEEEPDNDKIFEVMLAEFNAMRN